MVYKRITHFFFVFFSEPDRLAWHRSKHEQVETHLSFDLSFPEWSFESFSPEVFLFFWESDGLFSDRCVDGFFSDESFNGLISDRDLEGFFPRDFSLASEAERRDGWLLPLPLSGSSSFSDLGSDCVCDERFFFFGDRRSRALPFLVLTPLLGAVPSLSDSSLTMSSASCDSLCNDFLPPVVLRDCWDDRERSGKPFLLEPAQVEAGASMISHPRGSSSSLESGDGQVAVPGLFGSNGSPRYSRMEIIKKNRSLFSSSESFWWYPELDESILGLARNSNNSLQLVVIWYRSPFHFKNQISLTYPKNLVSQT